MQKLFSCLWKGRTTIFKKIKTSDRRIRTGESRCNLQEERFGTPIDIVKSYYDSLEDEDRLIDRACFSKYLKKILMVLIIILTGFFVYRSTLIYLAYLDGKDNKVIYIESTVEEEE